MAAFEALVDAALGATVVLASAGLLVLLLRRTSAARRHLIWTAAVVGVLVLPLLSIVLPGWHVLPRWTPAALVTTPSPSALEVDPAPVVLRTPEASHSGAAPRAVERPSFRPPVETALDPPGTASGSLRSEPAIAAALTPAPVESPPWPWQVWALFAWAIVGLVILGRVLLGQWSLHRLERRARCIESGPLSELAMELASELDLRRVPRLLESGLRAMPMQWGILRARVLLPTGAAEWLDSRLRLVLRHELAHALRRDCLTQLFAELACALYWFHPLAWLARHRMREEREAACDDVVLRSGPAPSDYADELLRVAGGHEAPRSVERAAIAMARPSTLERRLRAVLDPRRDRRVESRKGIACTAIVLGLALPVLAMVQPGEPVQQGQAEAGARQDREIERADEKTGDGQETAEANTVTSSTGFDTRAGSLVRSDPSWSGQGEPHPIDRESSSDPFSRIDWWMDVSRSDLPQAGGSQSGWRPPLEYYTGQDAYGRLIELQDSPGRRAARNGNSFSWRLIHRGSASRTVWSVTGKVTDPAGNALDGVQLDVQCGVGALRTTGSVWTYGSGRYNLQFDQAVRTFDEESGEWVAELQAAKITPRKSGWYEEDLAGRGDLLMASERPLRENAWGIDPDRVLLPGEPFVLDFIMQPGVRLVGELVEEAGVPAGNRGILLGSHRFLPSRRELFATNTDEGGRFVFDRVPLGTPVWLESAEGKSAPFQIDEPGNFRVQVQLGSTSALRLELQPLAPEDVPAALPRYLARCRVIDAETGEAIEDFVVSKGRVDSREPGGVHWYEELSRPEGFPDGRFSVDGPRRGGVLDVRVQADGYLAKKATVETTDGRISDPVVLRMRRAREVSGRVFDSFGRPVSNARVFLCPPKSGHVAHADIYGFGGGPELTGPGGGFVLRNVGGQTDEQIVVLSEHGARRVPVPPPGEDARIEMPAPATLVLRYDIPGDEERANVRLQLASWDLPWWQGSGEETRRVGVENGGQTVVRYLYPGPYDVSRDKALDSGELENTAMCDRWTVNLKAGERRVLDFVRKEGAQVTGRVIGLGKTKADTACVYIRDRAATGDPLGEDWELYTFDGRTTTADGGFRTALLEPGVYQAVAHVYEPLTEAERASTGWILPEFVGTCRFTVPAEGEPEAIEIEIERYEPK